MMLKETAETGLDVEFDRQVATLVQKGYPALAGLATEEFLQYLAPLRARVAELSTNVEESGDGRIPFVVVVKSDLVAGEKALPLVKLKGKEAFTSMTAEDIGGFRPIEGVEIPGGLAYLLVDVDTGAATLNVTPEEALKTLATENRSPLTLEEGIALLTHFPEVLRKNACFYMLGSRCGDRRVTALWLSGGRPRLGWCWAGNPHTWLGSASCGRRVGP